MSSRGAAYRTPISLSDRRRRRRTPRPSTLGSSPAGAHSVVMSRWDRKRAVPQPSRTHRLSRMWCRSRACAPPQRATLAVDDRDASEARRLNWGDAEVFESLGKFVCIDAESCGMDQYGGPSVQAGEFRPSDVGIESAVEAGGKVVELMEPLPALGLG